MKIYAILMILLSVGIFGVRYVFTAAVTKYFGLSMYLALAVVLAAGFILHNAALFLVFAGVMLIATVSSRMDAICRLVVMVALLPELVYPVSVGGIYLLDLTTQQVLTFAALLACLFKPGLPRRRAMSYEDALVFVLILSAMAAARGSNFTGLLRVTLSIALELGLPFFVFRRFVQDRAEFTHVIGVLAAAAMILAIVAIYEAKTHWSIYFPITNNLSPAGAINAVKMRGGLMRTPVSFTESTSYAVFAMVGIFAVIASRPLFRSRLLWSGGIALTLLGLLAAQSRGADLGLLVGLFLLLVVRRRYALAAAIAAAGLTIVALLMSLAASNPTVAALIGADSHHGADADYRQTLLRRGLQVGMEHPILGDDSQRVLAQMSDLLQGEHIIDFVNTYLTIFMSSGLVGLVTVIFLIICIFKKIFGAKITKNNQILFLNVQMFVAGSFGGELFSLAFTSFYERNPFWLIIILVGSRSLHIEAPISAKEFQRNFVDTAKFSDHRDDHAQLAG